MELEFSKLEFHVVKKKKKKPRWKPRLLNTISALYQYTSFTSSFLSAVTSSLSLTVPISLSDAVPLSRSGLSQSPALLTFLTLAVQGKFFKLYFIVLLVINNWVCLLIIF